ncbi:MAG: VanW family protein [Clostridia bacterium]|nr:VanW family protein [Clostridia bacterium]
MRPLKTLLILLLTPVMLLCGCAPRYATLEEALQDGARIPRGVMIDGADVGGMTIDEAKTAMQKAHAQKQKATAFTVVSSNGRVVFDASALPIDWKREEALLEAVNLSALSFSQRELQCGMQLHGEGCRSKLEALCASLDVAAKDAVASYDDGKFSYTEASHGRKVDVAQLAKDVTAALKEGGEITAVVRETAPVYTTEQAKADTARLARFRTSFAGGTYGKANRVYNIKKAARAIDGYCIQPGEEFNMNDVLGARNGENGWRKATAIRYGVYVDEYGGGVCQVSTTLYNAVLLAELSVTERHHHSWPLGYVDIGQDATISTDGPNFRFVNDKDKPVYLSALVNEEEKTITVQIFGPKRTDGLSVKLRSQKVEHLDDPGSELVVDSSLAYGTLIVERESRSGSVSETHRLYYDAAGEMVARELVTRDKYRPLKGIIRVSPDQKQRALQKYDISQR